MATTTFRMAEGSRTTPTRTVQGVSGGGFIRINTALATPSNGDIVEVFTGGLSGNIGFYTLVNFSGGVGGLGLYVRPAPNIQLTAGGSIARLNRAAGRVGATGISGVVALSGENNLAMVWAPGANFLTNRVRRNDRAAISGTSISGNMGGWYVQEVLSEDKVILRPPDRGAGLSSALFPVDTTGTIAIRVGVHVVQTVLTENEQLNWTQYAVSGILPVSGASLFQGSGELRDYLRVIPASGVSASEFRNHIQITGISKWIFTASGLSGVGWLAKDEIVSAPPVAAETGDIHQFRFSTQSGNLARPLIVRLGSPVFINGAPASGAVDRYSVISGAAWAGIAIPGSSNVSVQWHGSYWDPQDGDNIQLLSGTSGVASIFRGASINPPTGWLSESMVTYGSFGLVAAGSPDIQNMLIPSTFTTGSVSTAGATFEGLILGAGVLQPFAVTLFSSGDPAVVLNPRVDFNIFDYFYLLLGGGSVEKQFTYNPRYRDENSGAMISGLYVEIYEVSDITGESLLLAEFSDVEGRIGGGVGYNLRTQRIDGATGFHGGTLTNYTYRVVTQGGGWRLISRDHEFTEKFVQDVAVQHMATDYEGEYSE